MPKNFNLQRELAERSDLDWHFGALSAPALVSIPLAERKQYLPVGETQFDAYADFTDCASRSPVNHLEAIFTYHYQHAMLPENKKWFEDNGYVQDGKITFSDRYIAILSGTTHDGNSLKSPLEAIRKQGLIPKKLLPKEDWMKWEDYYDSSKITPFLKNLGQEFLSRFTINYEQVAHVHFADVLKDDMLGVAGFAWPNPVNGVYLPTDGNFNHAFLIYNLPQWQIFDNYLDPVDNDFDKNLSPSYKFYDFGYRVYVAKEQLPSKTTTQSIYDQLAILIAKISQLFTPIPVSTIKVNKLYDTAYSFIGKDASPRDQVPDEVSCAESLSNVLQKAFPELQFPIIVGTKGLYDYLIRSPSFLKTDKAEKGNIILSVTGTGNGKIDHGHTGICGRLLSPDGSLWIMSNNSDTGTWEVNLTLNRWKQYYEVKGGMPTLFFKPV